MSPLRGNSVDEVPRRDARSVRIDTDLEPVERIAGRVRVDFGANAGKAGERIAPECEI